MNRPSLARRLGTGSVAVLALAVPAACGGSDDGGGNATSAEGEAAGSEESPDSADSGGELEQLTGEEFFPTMLQAMQDAGTATFEMTSTSEGGPGASNLEMSGDARFGADSVDMKAASSGAGGFSMVYVDGVLYMQGQGLDLGDATWLKVDTNKASQESSLFGALARTANPMDTFAAMGAPDELELLGEETVDGVPTHHYRIGYASRKFAEAMQMPPALAKFLPKQIGVELWVDADDLPRRFHQEVETSIPNGPTSTTVVDGSYSDFGTEVEIEAPADSEVTERLELEGMPQG
jgi:hypothetical protein